MIAIMFCAMNLWATPAEEMIAVTEAPVGCKLGSYIIWHDDDEVIIDIYGVRDPFDLDSEEFQHYDLWIHPLPDGHSGIKVNEGVPPITDWPSRSEVVGYWKGVQAKYEEARDREKTKTPYPDDSVIDQNGIRRN